MAPKYTITLDEAELTLRFVEAVTGVPTASRVPGVNPGDVLDHVRTLSHEHVNMVDDLNTCAKVAMEYFAEMVADGISIGGTMTMTRIDRAKPN